MSAARIISKFRPAIQPGVDAVFDQVWSKVQRQLVDTNDENSVTPENSEIKFHSTQSLLVTSWSPREGRTTFALALATRAAHTTARDVCLVDADMKAQSSLTNACKATGRPGLAELLSESETIDQVMIQLGKTGPFLIPGGRTNLNSLNYDDRKIMSMIDRLEARFRYIIFDAPCLRQGSDIYKLGRAVSNTLLVAACRQVRRQTIAHSVSTMRLQGMKVIGTVLNRRVETIPSWLYPYL